MWVMELCLASKDSIEKTFENLEDGYDWLRQNGHGDYLSLRFRVDGPDFKQFGTGYFWVSFRRLA